MYFSNDKHGNELASELAANELTLLNKNKTPFSESVKHGDRFLYHLNYVEREPDYIESHFGAETANKLFELEPSESSWRGPYKSPYGYHLVLLTENEKAVYPELEDVYEQVRQDLTYNILNDEKEKSIQDIVDSYDVKILYKKDTDNIE